MEFKIDITKLDKSKSVLVACSGGRDSMTLLHCLMCCGFDLAVAHIDHNMRENSERDKRFVESFANEFGLKFFCATAGLGELSGELQAREFRYVALEKIATEFGYSQIVMAHHRSDQVESVLMHLFRGAGASGVTGMRAVAPAINYNSVYENGRHSRTIEGKHQLVFFRPLLNVSREEIDEYVETNNLPYVTDESNNSDEYTRNYLRLNVFNKIAVKYPEYEKNVAEFASEIRSINEFIDGLIELPAVDNGEIHLELDTISLHPALCYRTVYQNVKRFVPLDLTRLQIGRVVDLFSARTGTTIDIKGDVKATKDSDCVTIYVRRHIMELNKGFSETANELNEFGKSEKLKEFGYVLNALDGGNCMLMNFEDGNIQNACKDYNQNNNCQGSKEIQNKNRNDIQKKLYFDLAKIPSSATWRHRLEGDKFRPFGSGLKSLKEYLIDKKIPQRIKDELVLLCDGQRVLLIAGVEIGDEIKVDDGTNLVVEMVNIANSSKS